MMMKQILLTNDDGIESHGLWAAASSLVALGDVTIVAPSAQWSGAGRGLPRQSSGMIREVRRDTGGRPIPAFAVDASPAQAVLFALLEILSKPPDLVVAGINYGENVGTGITISGTVGAALEAASAGISAMAVSLQTPLTYHGSNSDEIDFSVAAYFGCLFAEKMLRGDFHSPDIDVLKVDVPITATKATPWKITRVSRQRYYIPSKPLRDPATRKAAIPYSLVFDDSLEPGSDVYALHNEKIVSVSPVSIDLSSRINREALESSLRKTPLHPKWSE
jgi:5'-nucleotidase